MSVARSAGRRGAVAAAIGVSLLVAACGGTASRAPSSTEQPTGPASRPVAEPSSRRASPGRPSSRPPAHGVITHGSRSRRWVALTFDADMTRGMLGMLHAGRVRGWHDDALFAQLRATRTPATIFLTGLWTRTYPDLVGRLARDHLFELENHSFDHAGWTAPCYGLPAVSDAASKRREIALAARIIERTANVTPRFFRFPGGCQTDTDVRLVESYGEHPVGWDVVSGDAFQPSARAIVRAVLAGVRPGSIVIAHCIGAPNAPATAAAMRVIIPALRARGYRFVTLERLLSRPSATRGR